MVAVSSVGKRFGAPRVPSEGDVAAPTRAPDPMYAAWPDRVRGIVPLRWSADFAAITGSPLTWTAVEGWSDPHPRLYIVSEYENLQAIGLARMLTGERMWQGDVAETWADFGDAIKAYGRDAARIIQALGPVIGIIPGIGQGVAAAIAAATALALGQPLDQAIVAIAANVMPGGGLAKTLVEGAAQSGSALLQGKDVGEAALSGARAAVKSEGGDLAASAFDAGIAVARGKELQEAGFAAMRAWVSGNDLAERGEAFTEKLVHAAESGKPVRDLLLDEAVGALSNSAATGVRSAIDALLKAPDDRLLPIEDLARKLRVAIPVARAAIMSVTEEGREDPSVSARFLRVVEVKQLARHDAMDRELERYVPTATQGYGRAFSSASSVFSRATELRSTATAVEREAAAPAPAAPVRHDGLLVGAIVAAIAAVAFWISKRSAG